MNDDFDKAFKFTVGEEGGFSDNPKDRGNWTSGKIGQGELQGTKFGISSAAYPMLVIKDITLEEAKGIYRTDYWVQARCDDKPWPFNLIVFDTAVNMGVKKALEFYNLGGSWQDYLFERIRYYAEIKTFKNFGRGWIRRVIRLKKLADKDTHPLSCMSYEEGGK